MKVDVYRHAVDQDQLAGWRDQGFLLLRGVLGPDEIARFAAIVDRMDAELRRRPGVRADAVLDRRSVMEDDPAFLDLMDHARTFPVVLELMGPHIQLAMSQILVRPPDPELRNEPLLHTDGGEAMRRVRTTDDDPPLMVKLQFFLTDVLERECGNFTVVPGSHRRPFPEGGVPDGPYAGCAVQILARAGDVSVHPHSLWHGHVRNRSARPRKSLIYGYSQLFLRAHDNQRPSAALLARCSRRRRRLVGDVGEWCPGKYFYSPGDQAQVMAR